MRILLALLAVAGVGIAAGVSPDRVVEEVESVVGIVVAESSELAIEEDLERDLSIMLGHDYSLLDDPECDADVLVPDGEDETPKVTSFSCVVPTLELGAVEIASELRFERPVLLLTDRDTQQVVQVVDDPVRLAWLPLVAEPSPTSTD